MLLKSKNKGVVCVLLLVACATANAQEAHKDGFFKGVLSTIIGAIRPQVQFTSEMRKSLSIGYFLLAPRSSKD